MTAAEQMKRAMTSQTVRDAVNWIATAPDPLVRDEHDVTALMYASKSGHTAAVDLLLNKAAGMVPLQNVGGDTALHIACQEGHGDVVERLLAADSAAKTVVNTPNDHGNTALHFACFWRHVEICQMLIEAGAVVDAANKYGKVPADFAGATLKQQLKLESQTSQQESTAPAAGIASAARSMAQVEAEARAKRIAQIRRQQWDIATQAISYGELLWKADTCDVYSGKCYGKLAVIRRRATRGISLSNDEVAAFRRSIEPLQTLEHPNLLPVVGACFDPASLSVVYECEALETLQQLLHSDQVELEITDVLQIGRDICSAMQYLYDSGASHLGLTSRHIMMTADNRAKLMAFGLYDTALGPLSETAVKILEPQWVAQEVLMSGRVVQAQAADVYSFGVVLYELVTRQPPFGDGVNHMTLGLKIALEGCRPEIPPYVPEHLRRLMELCWHQQADTRPSFEDIAAVLAQ